jgi:cell division protein FtsQ
MARRENRKIKKSPFPKVQLDFKWSAVILPIILTMFIYFSSDHLVATADIPLKDIILIGELAEIDLSDIEQIILSEKWLGFFSTDIVSIQHKLVSLPWVYAARVRKSWPDKIILEIVEEIPMARWGNYALINQDGVIYPVEDTNKYSYLPKIFGPVGTELEIHNAYKALVDSAMQFNLTISEVEMSARGSWQVYFEGNKIVHLGKEHLDEKTDLLFEKVIPSIFNTWGEIKEIDLRYQNGFAVKFNEENYRFSNT